MTQLESLNLKKEEKSLESVPLQHLNVTNDSQVNVPQSKQIVFSMFRLVEEITANNRLKKGPISVQFE